VLGIGPGETASLTARPENEIPGIAEYEPRLLGRCQGSTTAERGARSAALTLAGPRLLSGYPRMSSTSPRSFIGTLFGALLK
jgi:hypothetical protein